MYVVNGIVYIYCGKGVVMVVIVWCDNVWFFWVFLICLILNCYFYCNFNRYWVRVC